MKLIRNAGTERVVDLVQPFLSTGHSLDLLTSSVSLIAFETLREGASKLSHTRLVLPHESADLSFFGSEVDRPSRNRLQLPRLTKLLAEWLRSKAEVRRTASGIPLSLAVVRQSDGNPLQAVHGAFGLSTDRLGLAPGNLLSFILASESPQESQILARWFDGQWAALDAQPEAAAAFLAQLDELASPRDPMDMYATVLYHLFGADSQNMGKDRIVKAATGIRETVVWKKLYKFQRDGVVGAIDKLERFGGCIITDSVGLGKTFEALAVIKYHELRNDRVLVLFPKRLRDYWTLLKANDQRNILASDRLNYDVLKHTDLSRDGGLSGDIDLNCGDITRRCVGRRAIRLSRRIGPNPTAAGRPVRALPGLGGYGRRVGHCPRNEPLPVRSNSGPGSRASSGLAAVRQLQAKLVEERVRAQKERQLSRHVALNLEIKQLVSSIESMRQILTLGSTT